MTSVDTKDIAGKKVGTAQLDDAIFGVQPNIPVMQQVVVAQLAARRAGTQSTKTRAEVRGGGAKPWRQKGTGRARQGSTRSPQWRGGGVALGPKPRSYAQRTPKKMIRLALRSALSDRAADDRVVVLDKWGIDEPSTKAAVAALSALGVDGHVLVVVTLDEIAAWKSLRNLPDVHVQVPGELNAYDVLCSDWVIFTEASLPTATKLDVKKGDAGKTEAGKGDAKQSDAKQSDAKRSDAPAPEPAAATDDGDDAGEEEE